MSETIDKSVELNSLVTEEGEFKLFLKEVAVPEPGENEVVVKVEASPINPSDQAALIFPADVSTGSVSGEGLNTVYTAKLKPNVEFLVKPRIGIDICSGNEAAGVVVKAGASDAAQALLGKTISLVDGTLYCQYRKVNVMQCMPLNEGTSPAEGASSYVNPLTALSMTEAMRLEGFNGLIHTAAASNLGQMLNRICVNDGINLINIVRKEEQVTLLKSQGAKYVCNSSSENFRAELTSAIEETGAYLAFDAIGGGALNSEILLCMENAAAKKAESRGPYGTDVFKQIYIYGSLDFSPTTIHRNFGFYWGINSWLLTPFLGKVGLEKTMAMRKRVADEIKTTFASHYSKEISLEEALQPDIVATYSKQATGEKFLITPFK